MTLRTILYQTSEKSLRAIYASAKVDYQDRYDVYNDARKPETDVGKWFLAHREALAKSVLRFVDPVDDEIAGMVREGDLVVPEVRHRQLGVRFCFEGARNSDTAPNAFPITQLAASTVGVLQTATDLAAAFSPCGVEFSEPTVTLEQGSIQIRVRGGLFASGVGVLLAAATGIVGSPVAAGLAGAALATGGLVGLALDWRRTVTETAKLQGERKLIDAQTRLAEAELAIKEAELQRARVVHGFPALRSDEPDDPPWPDAASALIPPDQLEAIARAHGWSPAFVSHVANRGLPSTRHWLSQMTGVRVEVDRPG